MRENRKMVLDAIVKEVKSSGVCPTLGMIATRVPLLSSQTINGVIGQLMRSGHVRQEDEWGAPIEPLLTSDDRVVAIWVSIEGEEETQADACD